MKVEHFYERIDGWFKFAPEYRSAVAAAPARAIFVEVGCWQGRSTAFLAVEILESGKDVELHCVDIWPAEPALDAQSACLKERFEANLSPAVENGLRLILHPEGSPAAASAFPARSVDFVWLDGGHRYDEVRGDLDAWLPKLKPGGIIGGDDWLFPGVARAVRERFRSDVEVRSHDGWAWWRHRVKPRRK